VIVSLTLTGPPGDDRLPSAAATGTLARVLAALEDLHAIQAAGVARTGRECLAAVTTGLDQLVTDLGEAAAAAVARAEGRSIAAKLVAIGLDRRRHPERHRELGRVYGDETGFGESPLGRRSGPGVVRIRREHIREEYRLAWEFRLLVFPALHEAGPPGIQRPGTGGAGPEPADQILPGGPVYTYPTFEGVRRIGSEASVVTLVFAFRHACRDDGDRKNLAAWREYTLDALEALGSVAALAAILDCAEWAGLQWARHPPEEVGPRGAEPAKWVENLAAPGRPDRARWAVAFGRFPVGSLTARQRALLAAARRRLDDR
jgi:hypothetical protein